MTSLDVAVAVPKTTKALPVGPMLRRAMTVAAFLRTEEGSLVVWIFSALWYMVIQGGLLVEWRMVTEWTDQGLIRWFRMDLLNMAVQFLLIQKVLVTDLTLELLNFMGTHVSSECGQVLTALVAHITLIISFAKVLGNVPTE